MRVVVIGGGIAGCAVALGLHKAGTDVAVYEAHPASGADLGAFLTLASNGMIALGALDAAAPVASTGWPLTRMRVLDATGTELAAVPLGEHTNPLARYRCLRRADLVTVLQAELAARGIPLHHDHRLIGVDTRAGPDGGDRVITARFARGEAVGADLLIGADGINSVVRGVIEPAATPPRYAGQRVFYGYRSGAPVDEPVDRITMVRGSGAAFGYATSPDGEVYWFAREPGDELAADEIGGTSPEVWRERLVGLLGRDDTPAAGIVAGTGDRLMVTNARDLAGGVRWYDRRMLLVGDAAHAASPATGQGASMALEDAVVLAKALRAAGTGAGASGALDAAVASYTRIRRPRVERNAATSARLTAARPGAATGPPSPDRPSTPRQDVELMRLLDWDTPLNVER
jgi:2-polyprenyl-6-methoxyphenol hydroxylase-like FAD-dependent oxidoreductase